MALSYSKISYEHREILLKERPKILYDLSKKGTVPVLQLIDGTIVDESIDIMKWCINQSDLDGWYNEKLSFQDGMILNNDNDFKFWLDRYKYHVRFAENSFEEYQENIKFFFDQYNCILENQSFLAGNKLGLVDIALMPFVRQAAHVDLKWFSKKFKALYQWLEKLKESSLFISVMTKYKVWTPSSQKNIVKW